MSSGYRGLFDLTGRVAIVTGGAGILGRCFCHGLAESGADVVVADIREADARAVAEEIQKDHGKGALGAGCDVSDEGSVGDLVAKAVQRFGRIDILHNNAASKSEDLAAFFAPVEEYSLKEWRQVMSVNLDGLFLVAKAVGARMKEQGTGGSIIQTSSIYGIVASDKRVYEGSEYMGRPISNPPVYSASKAGVIGLTRHLAAYWGDAGIRVNALVPGGVESGQNETFKQHYAARVPMGRMAQAHEMVGALIFLASPASSYMTGQTLVVDGGLTCW
jgi:NAD(P)-dependent dehydrogenase (short-subunit alcohol dehydrogenase family)